MMRVDVCARVWYHIASPGKTETRRFFIALPYLSGCPQKGGHDSRTTTMAQAALSVCQD